MSAKVATQPALVMTLTAVLSLLMAGCPPPPDGDADGVPDSGDNCPATANADQADADGEHAARARPHLAQGPLRLTGSDDARRFQVFRLPNGFAS